VAKSGDMKVGTPVATMGIRGTAVSVTINADNGATQVSVMAEADNLFNEATEMSTASETYLNYATFLAAQNRNDEARQWARRILAKKPTMPRYLQRRERPWFRKASALLKLLGAVG